ncbi:MAG: hypothetical protein IT340_14100 [Chloroflexi bacterium]|nr:hypothetical protein [Chloroflexota bacterium]
MPLVPIDALTGLRAALEAPAEQRLDIFRSQVMEPLRPFWEPSLRFMPPPPNADPADPALTAARAYGYFTPDLDVAAGLAALDRIDQAGVWAASLDALDRAWQALAPATHGVALDSVRVTLVLGDPAVLGAQPDSYTGAGGQPGMVVVMAWPTATNLPKLPAAAVHELNHNIRFSIEPFIPQLITVGQYIVAEGLAEAFAAEQCGVEHLGPWSDALTADQVAAVLPRFRDAIDVAGFDQVRGYIFGDWAAATFGYRPQGLPDFAGYTIGYRLVRDYLARTGETAATATYRPWREIVDGSGLFAS